MMRKLEQLNEEEQKELNELSDKELLFILKCVKLKEIEKKLSSKMVMLTAIAKKRSAHLKNSSNKISESLLEAINPTSYLTLILDAGFTLITSMTLVPFSIVIGGFVAIFAVVGGVYFKGVHEELKKKDKKMNESYQLLALKNECAEVYLKRKQSPYIPISTESQNSEPKVDKKKWQKAKNILATPIIVTGALFYTYYAVTQALMIAFAGSLAIGAMAGPIGIGVVLGVSLAIGIYFGYKKYQAYKKEEMVAVQHKKMQSEFEVKYKTCKKIRSKELESEYNIKYEEYKQLNREPKINREEKDRPSELSKHGIACFFTPQPEAPLGEESWKPSSSSSPSSRR